MELTGTFFRYETGPIYGKSYSEEAVDNIIEQFQKFGKTMYGKLDPGDNPDESSHIIKELWKDPVNRALCGTLELLDTSTGNKVIDIYNTGANLDVETRTNYITDASGYITFTDIYSFYLNSGGEGIAVLNLIDPSIADASISE